MKSKLLALAFLAAGSVFAQPRVAIGVGVGVGPVAPYAVAAPCPGPGYAWVDGGYYFNGGVRLWRPGYWRAPVFGGYAGGYYGGYRGGFVGRGYAAPRFDNHFVGHSRGFVRGRR